MVSWSSSPSAPAALDVCALRLGPDGNVRADDDFVFFNAPRTRDGSLEHPGPASPDTATAERIRVDLAAQPDTVDRIVVTATIDTATPELTFADVRDVAVDVLAGGGPAGGTHVARFTPPALSSGRALVLVEGYRRAGGWRLRAVGQGYATGLAGLATD